MKTRCWIYWDPIGRTIRIGLSTELNRASGKVASRKYKQDFAAVSRGISFRDECIFTSVAEIKIPGTLRVTRKQDTATLVRFFSKTLKHVVNATFYSYFSIECLNIIFRQFSTLRSRMKAFRWYVSWAKTRWKFYTNMAISIKLYWKVNGVF